MHRAGSVVVGALIFALVYFAEGVLTRNYNLDEFQVATGYLKDQDPQLFPNDFIWSKPDLVRNLHVCVRSAMRFTDGITAGILKEPIDLYLLWLPFCIFIFFVGIYLLCFRFTGDHWASFLVACSFMLVRRTVGDWWGLGPMYTMSARGLTLSFMPLCLWSYFRYRDRLLQLTGCFFAWGLVSNLHPLSGWGFVEFLGITILLVERLKWKAFLEVSVLTGATLIGSIPFILVWKDVVLIPPELQADPLIIKQFWDGFIGLDIPSLKYVRDFFEDLLFPGILSLLGFIYWQRHAKEGERKEWTILYLFPCVVLGVTLLVMFGGAFLKKAGFSMPVMVAEHYRNSKMVYLTLPVWMGLALHAWFQRNQTTSRRWRYGIPCLIILLSMAINFPGHKLARTLLLKMGLAPSASVKRWERVREENAADLEVAHWAKAHTSPDALFYFDSYEFRYYARRSLVFCWFDRPCVAFHPSKELEEWIRRRDRVKPLKDRQDTQGMMVAAQDYGANYLVVLNSWMPLGGKPVWSNSKYSVYEVTPNSLK